MAVDRSSWIVDEKVRSELLRVQALISQLATADAPDTKVHAQMLHPRAKRIRPAFVLLAASFGRPVANEEHLLRAAAAVELVHEATLYHDDIVDEAEERRGLPSVFRQFGARVAAGAGSELLYAGAELCSDLSTPIRRKLATTAMQLAHAQRREVASSGNVDATSLDELRVMCGKTGSLFRLAAYMGATLAETQPSMTARVLRFAGRFGVCYQLADDLADLFSDTHSLGRAPGSDLLDGVATLPVLAALRESGTTATDLRSLLAEVFESRDRSLLEEAIVLLRCSRGVRRIRAILEHWIETTVDSLPAATNDASAAAVLSFHRLCEELHARASALPCDWERSDGCDRHRPATIVVAS